MLSLLDKWKRPAGDTGLGAHMSANYGDTRYQNAAVLDSDMRLLRKMKITRVKFLMRGDSQVNAVRAFAQGGFIPSVRYYKHVLKEGVGALPENELELYAKAGAVFCEGSINEYDNESGRPPSPENIAVLADYWQGHANSCARVGLIPLSPAFEGDRLERWVLPMVREMLDRGWRDQVRGSVFAGHFRPGAYWGPERDSSIPPSMFFPPDANPVEPGDQTGFVWRSHEQWAKKLNAMLGYTPLMQSTEAGIEPSECTTIAPDGSMRRENLSLHADFNRRIAEMAWPVCMDAVYFWIMTPGGMGGASAWFDNERFANPLPVIQAFCDMPAPVRSAVVKPPPTLPEPPPTQTLPIASLRKQLQAKKPAVEIHEDWALFDAARKAGGLGNCLTPEYLEGNYLMQKWSKGGAVLHIADAAIGAWDKIIIIRF